MIQTDFNAQRAEGLTYSFEDRLEEPQFIGQQAMRDAVELAEVEVGNTSSARFVEQLLRHAFDDPNLWVGHIKTGVKENNGHPFRIFGYSQSRN